MDPSTTKAPTSDQVSAPPLEKPKKEKKPPTEAQQAAREKGLQAMMAKRKQMAEQVKEKREKVKVAKKVIEDKILKDDLGFVSHKDFEEKYSSLQKEVFELRGMLTAKQQAAQEKPVSKPAERIVERVIERVPTPSAQPAKLTGHALLDSLFFK